MLPYGQEVHVMARKNQRINEVTLLGINFIRWGLGLFIFGLIIGYSPLVHYLHGACCANFSMRCIHSTAASSAR